jgi:hypothetical protein
MDQSGLKVGVMVKQIATRDNVFEGCRVLHSDATGVVFEVERTISEGGQIETVVSQVLVPWASINHVLVMEEKV